MSDVISEEKALDEFEKISSQIVRLFARKNEEHGNSFFKGDLRDLHHSLRRKWHRIETKLMDGDAKDASHIRQFDVESLIEDLKDLSAFSVMGIVMLMWQDGNRKKG